MKLNEKHFELFKKECKYWIKKFGLIGWSIHYKFSDKIETFAQCKTSYTNRTCIISLSNKDLKDDNPVTDNIIYEIKKTAFHEVMELFLSPFCALGGARSWDEEVWDREQHAIIRTLENIIIKGE